ncbi:hypothetical protein [Streptomyces sp. BE133]|uniref:hypothetical protein n=1 Tax=Streptomyces sp. BE133 TaxID=3002523 RepID=UPI002E78EC23|nr:hypothetical protein [Streptomyces sp. BE133]MEE1812654.1 hypothetical protein [Streptomyces sp. BE133]
MSALTAEQRGDLAEDMLPVAAHLAVLVHGDGGPEDVQEVLESLNEAQRNALIVVLAGLVDPEQPMGKALGWLDSDEHGALTVPHWGEDRTVRDMVPVPEADIDADFVDPVAVQRFVEGHQVVVSDAEFLVALERCIARGMTYPQVDQLRRSPKGTTGKAVNRLRKAYTRAGRELPPALQTGRAAVLTDVQVLEIRHRYAAGGITILELAMSYGVGVQTVGHLLTGRTHKAAGGPFGAKRATRPSESSRSLFNKHTPGFDPVVDVAQAS